MAMAGVLQATLRVVSEQRDEAALELQLRTAQLAAEEERRCALEHQVSG